MPTVHVNVWKGFEEEKVKYLIENLTKVFVNLGIPAEAVEILVHEVPQSHWGIGGIPASEKNLKMLKYQDGINNPIPSTYFLNTDHNVNESSV